MTAAPILPTREQSLIVCAHYRRELFGYVLEYAGGDERERALIFAALIAARIAELTVDRVWS